MDASTTLSNAHETIRGLAATSSSLDFDKRVKKHFEQLLSSPEHLAKAAARIEVGATKLATEENGTAALAAVSA